MAACWQPLVGNQYSSERTTIPGKMRRMMEELRRMPERKSSYYQAIEHGSRRYNRYKVLLAISEIVIVISRDLMAGPYFRFPGRLDF